MSRKILSLRIFCISIKCWLVYVATFKFEKWGGDRLIKQGSQLQSSTGRDQNRFNHWFYLTSRSLIFKQTFRIAKVKEQYYTAFQGPLKCQAELHKKQCCQSALTLQKTIWTNWWKHENKISDLKNMAYKSQWKKLCLFSLSKRYPRGEGAIIFRCTEGCEE